MDRDHPRHPDWGSRVDWWRAVTRAIVGFDRRFGGRRGGRGLVVFGRRNKPAAGAEVLLESAESIGKDPFTASVSTPQPPGTVPVRVRPRRGGRRSRSHRSRLRRRDLSRPTRHRWRCARSVVLRPVCTAGAATSAPAIAAYWSTISVRTRTRVRPGRAYWGFLRRRSGTTSGTLTQVVLRGDTRVTNHGFANGKAYPCNRCCKPEPLCSSTNSVLRGCAVNAVIHCWHAA